MSLPPVPVPFVPPPVPVLEPEPYDARTDIRPFVRFNPDGSIRYDGRQGVGYTWAEMEENPYICVGDGRFNQETGEHESWVEDGVVRPRPVLDAAFDQLELAPYEEASIAELPAGQVSFTGPVTGEVEHEGGPFEIGWTVPGDYTVTIRCWPHMPATFSFTVA